jgi:hypothetical protein
MMEHNVESESYQQPEWPSVDPNTHWQTIPQPITMSYVSNASASSTFPGNSENGIYYDEIAGSSHLMTFANEDTETTFPIYDANSYYM